jgi:hypothetical protein
VSASGRQCLEERVPIQDCGEGCNPQVEDTNLMEIEAVPHLTKEGKVRTF